jgi:hypothetical protein
MSTLALPEAEDRELFELIDVACEAATDKALLCIIDGARHWVPRSQVDVLESDVQDKGDEGSLVITLWLACKAGFVSRSP